MKSRLLTVKQVAERLQVRVSWIYGKTHDRTLPFRHCKIGGYVRIPEDTFEKYIERQIEESKRLSRTG